MFHNSEKEREKKESQKSMEAPILFLLSLLL